MGASVVWCAYIWYGIKFKKRCWLCLFLEWEILPQKVKCCPGSFCFGRKASNSRIQYYYWRNNRT